VKNRKRAVSVGRHLTPAPGLARESRSSEVCARHVIRMHLSVKFPSGSSLIPYERERRVSAHEEKEKAYGERVGEREKRGQLESVSDPNGPRESQGCPWISPSMSFRRDSQVPFLSVQ